MVVSSGEPVADLLPDEVRHLHLDGSPTVGAMRNAGCSQALGELVCHFDDDDFSAAGRLADQVSRLLDHDVAVAGYHSMLFTDGARWWRYVGVSNYALGTSLLYRRSWWQLHQFPNQQKGEDNDFVYYARDRRQLIAADAGELMFATNHNGNTSPRDTGSSAWKPL